MDRKVSRGSSLTYIALAVALLFIGLAAPSRLLGDSAADKPARWSATNFGHTILTRSMWLNRCVPASQVVSWKLKCGLGGATGSRLEQLHIWLGEYALAHDHDPYLADWHFAQAQAAGTRQDPLYGIASFDRALCSFREGEYKKASDAFYNLLIPRTALPGYDRLSAAVWYRKAAALAAYHA